jgi:hypothetical protein
VSTRVLRLARLAGLSGWTGRAEKSKEPPSKDAQGDEQQEILAKL